MKYLEIDSTHRDRNKWPNPGEFDILSSQGRTETTTDPVSLGAPIKSWRSNYFSTADSKNLTGTLNYKSSLSYFIKFDMLRPEKNYYRNALMVSNRSNMSARIKEYKFISPLIGKFTVYEPTDFTVGSIITIKDPTTNGLIFVPCSDSIDEDVFNKKMLLLNESISQYTRIIDYDYDTSLLSITVDETWKSTHNYSILNDLIHILLPNIVSTNGLEIIYTTMYLNRVPNGSFLRICDSGRSDNDENRPFNDIRPIIKQYGSTGEKLLVHPPFSKNNIDNLTGQILYFSYDNFSPLVFRSPPIMVNYNIKLLNLIMPIFNNPTYVYVELSILDCEVHNHVISNNPNSTKVMFRASIKNVQEKFINFDGDNSIQTMRFLAGGTFHLKITLPNGEFVSTLLDEYFSPHAPNKLIQTSVLFELDSSNS